VVAKLRVFFMLDKLLIKGFKLDIRPEANALGLNKILEDRFVHVQ
jgi:hypothetical protein